MAEESERDKARENTPPPRPWGFMIGDTFHVLPWGPLKRAGYTQPPFDVTLPSGEVRHVIEQPEN